MRIQDLLEAYDHGRTLSSFRDRLASALKKDRYPKYRDMDPEDALSWQRSSRTDTRSISSRTRRKEVQLAAVKNDGRAIQYIENPSEAVQLAAIKQDGLAIQYI